MHVSGGVAERTEGVLVFEVPFDSVDHTNAKELKRRLAQLTQPGVKLVLDLSRVKFMDSSGLGALLSTLRALVASGGDLKVCALTPAVRVLFELVRVHRVFDVLENREDAIGAFGD